MLQNRLANWENRYVIHKNPLAILKFDRLV